VGTTKEDWCGVDVKTVHRAHGFLEKIAHLIFDAAKVQMNAQRSLYLKLRLTSVRN
jgi:hypothetical protein